MRRGLTALLVGLLLGPLPAGAQTSAAMSPRVRVSLARLPFAQQTGGGGITGTGRPFTGTLTIPNLITTSTNGFVLVNNTPATAGVPVQMSPRMLWQGTAWDTAASETVAFFAETLPATAATPTGTWKLGYSLNGAAATYPLTVGSSGIVTSTNDIVSGASLQAATFVVLGASSPLSWQGRARFTSTADKLMQALDTGGTTGAEFNGGSATLGTCTAGTITTGSHNQAGGYTGNTSSSCVVNFGAPNWTNAPFCVAMSIASTTHPRVSAVSASSMTITGGISGEAITYICMGRIGT